MIELIHQAYEEGKFLDVRTGQMVDELGSYVVIPNEIIDELVEYYLNGQLYPAKYAPVIGITPLALVKKFKIRHGAPNSRVIYKDEVNSARRSTLIKKYGVDNPLKSPDIREKIKRTNIKRYGVDNPFKSQEIKDRIKQTNLEHYGVDNIFKSEQFKEHSKSICLERYGVENASQSEEIKEKKVLTSLNRYGVTHPLKCKSITDKIRSTCTERYGVDNVFKSDWFKDHSRKVNCEKYGVEYPVLLNHSSGVSGEILASRYNQMISKSGEDLESFIRNEYNNPYFNLHKFDIIESYEGSLAEQSVADWLDDNGVPYTRNFRPSWMMHPDTNRTRELDFFIHSLNIAVEVNGDFTHRCEVKDAEYHKFKFDRCLENGVKLIMITESDINTGRLDEVLRFNIFGGDISVDTADAVRLGVESYHPDCNFILTESGGYSHYYPVKPL